MVLSHNTNESVSKGFEAATFRPASRPSWGLQIGSHYEGASLRSAGFLLNAALFGFTSIWPTLRGTDTMRLVFHCRGSTLCIVLFGGCFSLAGKQEPPIFLAVVTPLEAGLLRHAFPTPQALHFQPVRLTDPLCLGNRLPFLSPASGTAGDFQLSLLQAF